MNGSTVHTRRCAVCGKEFEYHAKNGGALQETMQRKPKRRCLMTQECPQWKYCDLKDNAMSCATFRAVKVRKMKVEK